MLVHKDSIHLFINVFIQGILGFPLELEQGSIKCAAIYLIGGLSGSIGASIFSNITFMVGASGGIYGLLMSHISNITLVRFLFSFFFCVELQYLKKMTKMIYFYFFF